MTSWLHQPHERCAQERVTHHGYGQGWHQVSPTALTNNASITSFHSVPYIGLPPLHHDYSTAGFSTPATVWARNQPSLQHQEDLESGYDLLDVWSDQPGGSILPNMYVPIPSIQQMVRAANSIRSLWKCGAPAIQLCTSISLTLSCCGIAITIPESPNSLGMMVTQERLRAAANMIQVCMSCMNCLIIWWASLVG